MMMLDAAILLGEHANVVASFVVNWVGFCVRKGKGEESTFLKK